MHGGDAAPVAVGIIRVGAAPLALMTAAELTYPHVVRWACTAGMLGALHTPLARRGAAAFLRDAAMSPPTALQVASFLGGVAAAGAGVYVVYRCRNQIYLVASGAAGGAKLLALASRM
jgi:hypothetical protein